MQRTNRRYLGLATDHAHLATLVLRNRMRCNLSNLTTVASVTGKHLGSSFFEVGMRSVAVPSASKRKFRQVPLNSSLTRAPVQIASQKNELQVTASTVDTLTQTPDFVKLQISDTTCRLFHDARLVYRIAIRPI